MSTPIPQRRNKRARTVAAGDRLWRPTAQRFTHVSHIALLYGQIVIQTADGEIIAPPVARFLVAKDADAADRYNASLEAAS